LQGKAAALQLQQLRVRLQRLTEVHEQAVRTLKEKQATVVRLEQERTRFACLGNTTASKRHVRDLVNELEEEIRGAETALERQEGTAKEAAAALTEMQSVRDKLREKVECDRNWLKASEEERAAEEKGRTELAVQIERLMHEKGELERNRDGTGRKACVAAALLGRMSEQEERIPAWSLHSLFRFKSDAGLECEQYLEALNAVAGKRQLLFMFRQ
jgi:chromosome segregation ATPase